MFCFSKGFGTTLWNLIIRRLFLFLYSATGWNDFIGYGVNLSDAYAFCTWLLLFLIPEILSLVRICNTGSFISLSNNCHNTPRHVYILYYKTWRWNIQVEMGSQSVKSRVFGNSWRAFLVMFPRIQALITHCTNPGILQKLSVQIFGK